MKNFAAILLLAILLGGCNLTSRPPDFLIEINRPNSALEKDLIEKAEAACPTISFHCSLGPDVFSACHWWCNTSYGIRAPFALTADAINYYESRIQELRNAHNNSGLLRAIGATLYYSAHVEVRGAAAEQPVVTLTLRYHELKRFNYSFSTEIHRVVTFNNVGDIISVTGDGEPPIVN